MSAEPKSPRAADAWTRRLFGAVALTPWLLYRGVRTMAIMTIALGLCAFAVIETAKWEISLRLPEDSRNISDAREVTSVTVLDRDGALLGVRGQRFQTVSIEEAGPLVVNAILAAEDRRFFWHAGVDPIGVARALLVNFRAGETEQGGSSITQQVAKSFVGSEQTLRRKIRELAFALALEGRYSKDEILELYLNRAYLGSGAYGFRAAARLYFDVELSDLSAGQAALLAGMLRAPSNGFAGARGRALSIIEAMYRNGDLNYEETLRAWVEIETIQPNFVPESASFFVDYIVENVPPEVWEETDDIIVRTTLDLNAQRLAEEAIERVFEEHAGRDAAAEAATVILSAEGAIHAMVGARSYDPTRQAFNIATNGLRQLGSAFKPFIYAAAFEAGVSPGSNVQDRRVTVQTASGPYSPPNYSHRYLGSIPISVALARSSNVASLRLLMRAGIDRTVDLARRAGFQGDIPPYYPLALGTIDTNPLEVAGAYAIFLNEGRQTPPFAILEITDRDGNVLWHHQPTPGEQAIPTRHAAWLTSLMRGVVEAGTARRAQFEDGRPAAGKTGTTDDYSDAWFAGFTGDFIGVVWMGYRDARQPLDDVTGGSLPTMIWAEIMRPLHTGLPITPLPESSLPRSNGTVGGNGGNGGGSSANVITPSQSEAERRREALIEAERRRRLEEELERRRLAEERERRRERRREWRDRLN